MSRLDWSKAKINVDTCTITDEAEWTGRDAAARWLARQEKAKPAKPPKNKRPQQRREDRRQGPVHGNSGIVIYTDGACHPNPGRGGWGFAVYENGVEIDCAYGGSTSSTNNIMEMTGVQMALHWLIERGIAATVISDSQYVVKGCNQWRHSWRARGWKRNDGGKLCPVKNVDLWKEIDALLGKAKVKIEWCKGHVGIVGNERADELSNIGRRDATASVAAIRDQLRYTI